VEAVTYKVDNVQAEMRAMMAGIDSIQALINNFNQHAL
jgi:hypothetical protein